MYVRCQRGGERIEKGKDDGDFCRAYLRTMDPDRAAMEISRRDGYSLLGRKSIQDKLERMRTDAAAQVRRDDAIRCLAQLAFGRANDAVKLALHAGEVDAGKLDLSAVAEFKVTDKGGVEIKLVDRIRALDALCGLLERDDGHGTAEDLYRALSEAADAVEGGWEDG